MMQPFDFETFIQKVIAHSDPHRPDGFVPGLEAALASWNPEWFSDILNTLLDVLDPPDTQAHELTCWLLSISIVAGKRAESAVAAIEDVALFGRSIRTLGENAQSLGLPYEAVKYLRLAREIYGSLLERHSTRPLRAEVALTLVRLGRALAETGDTEDALRQLRDALEAYLRLGEHEPAYKSLAAHTCVMLADAFASASNLPRALEHYELAWGFYEEVGATDVDSRLLAAEMRLRVGSLFAELGDVQHAEPHLRAAIDEFEEFFAKEGMPVADLRSRARLLLGNLLGNSGDPSTALAHCRRARDEFKALLDERPEGEEARANLAHADMSIGDNLGDLGDQPGAVKQYELALDAYGKLPSRNGATYRAEAAHARLGLGKIRLHEGKLTLAMTELRAALEQYESLAAAGDRRALAGSARARTLLMNALAKHGDLTGSMEQYRYVLAYYDTLLTSGDEQHRAEAAQAGVEVGMVLISAGDLTGALRHHERSLEVFERLLASGSERYRESAAKTRVNLGTILNLLQTPAAAERQFRAALDDYQVLIDAGRNHFPGESVKARMGLGLALGGQGDLAAALAELYTALHDYPQPLATGGQYLRHISGSLHMNLGTILLRQGDTRAASTHLTAAWSEFDALIAAGHVQFRNEVANARANLGLVHERDFPAAQLHLHAALALYEGLISAGGVQYRGSAAQVRQFLGSALLASGDFPGAIAELNSVLAEYEARVASGFMHERESVMRVQITLGDAHRQQGELLTALSQYRAAAAIASSLYDDGCTQLIWARTLTARSRLGVILEHSKRPSGASHDVTNDIAEIISDLRCVAAATAKIGDDRVFAAMKDILTICSDAWKSNTDSTIAPELAHELRALAPHALAAWLAFAYRLLGDGRPTFLASHKTAIDLMISAGLALAVTAQHAPQCSLLDWVIHTQGLRAQRDLLSDTTDPQLQALATLWSQIDQLDRVALGQEADRVESTDTERAARREALASAYRERDALVTRRDELREQLAREGRLPDLDALARTHVHRHLAPDEELWLLLRLRTADEIHFGVIRVQAPLPAETRFRESFMFQVQGPSDAPTWTGQLQELDRFLATKSRSPIRRAPEPASSSSSTGPVTNRDIRDSVEALTQELWTATWQLLPVLRDMKQQVPQLRCVHLVPLGEAHALPWANALRDQLGAKDVALSVRQYPSVLAWMRARAFVAERGSAQSLRPAIVYDDARNVALSDGQSAYLPMVELEMAWSRALWARTSVVPTCVPASDSTCTPWPPVIDADQPVQALIGMGHGGAPDGNWARSGLWMPSWPGDSQPISQPSSERYFSAAHLPALSHVEHVVMSCCVLGRTDDQLGEPLGLLAQAFGARTRVAIGSLLPVDDGCAMFVSLAFQWRAIAAGPTADWVEEFHALRRDFIAGRWPDGFADWFQQRLAEALTFERDSRTSWVCGLARMVDWPELSAHADERAAQWQQLKAELPAVLMRAVPIEIRDTAGWFVAFG